MFGSQRLVDEHHGYAIANGIMPLAFGTHEKIALTGHRLLVERTGEDIQELLGNFSTEWGDGGFSRIDNGVRL